MPAIGGMTGDESHALLTFLMEQIIQHGFTCRLRWEPNMLVMWDIRLCLHLERIDPSFKE